ncbi:MAG TPA: hypothetical protein VGD31_17365 [Sphingobacteriaceae bacterium]
MKRDEIRRLFIEFLGEKKINPIEGVENGDRISVEIKEPTDDIEYVELESIKYMARITGTSDLYGFKREFINPIERISGKAYPAYQFEDEGIIEIKFENGERKYYHPKIDYDKMKITLKEVTKESVETYAKIRDII